MVRLMDTDTDCYFVPDAVRYGTKRDNRSNTNKEVDDDQLSSEEIGVDKFCIRTKLYSELQSKVQS